MVPSLSSHKTKVYNPKTFFLHAALLRQGCPHCAIFPTAASRRSLGRVSVPVWMIIFSNHLTIVDLVGHYPTNYLIVRRPVPNRPKTLIRRSYAVLATLSSSYPSVWGPFPRVTQPSAARQQGSTVLSNSTSRSKARSIKNTVEPPVTARLACIRHAASIHPEPGSNSPLKCLNS